MENNKKMVIIFFLISSSFFLKGSNNFFDSFSQFSSNVYSAKSQLSGNNGYSSLKGVDAIFLNPANIIGNENSISFTTHTSFENLIHYNQLSTNLKVRGYTLGIGFATKTIDDIYITNNAWNDNNQDNKINNQTEIDYSKIFKASEKEYLLVVGFPYKMKFFDFGLNLKQGYYSLNNYKNYSTSFDLGLSYKSNYLSSFGLSVVFSDLFLFKKWNNLNTEYFSPIVIESIFYSTNLIKLETSLKHSIINSSLYLFSIGSEIFFFKNNSLILGYSSNNYYDLSRINTFSIGLELDYKNNKFLYGINIFDDFRYEYLLSININYDSLKEIYNISKP